MSLNSWLQQFPASRIKSRPYINHSVEFKKTATREQRMQKLAEVGLNVFYFPSSMVSGVDMLSDSGTTTMTNLQWAALHTGDEAYGSNRGYFELMPVIQETFGKAFFNDPAKNSPNAFLFHQGRAAEHALFTLLSQTGNNLIIPSNGHFDTTQANIEANGIEALNLFSPELADSSSSFAFKGNMDTDKLKSHITKSKSRIPLIYLTITNNTGGGQPVSLENISEVAEVAHEANIPLFIDACRFAENSWFIKQNEQRMSDVSINSIVKKIFAHCDGFTISFKKDGLVNMGGGLFIKSDGLFQKKYPTLLDSLLNWQILTEGHPTYGGMSGRDIMTLVEGLKIVVQEEYLAYRVGQVREFGQSLLDRGIPVVSPIGGHAVYMDMNRFFAGTDKKPEDFGGISFTALFLGLYGHRACELGNFAFGYLDTKTNREMWPENNFVRFAIPRMRYEKEDLEAVVDAVAALYKNRDQIPPVRVTYGKELPLRHFKARFEFV